MSQTATFFQQTVASVVEISGRGLFSGVPVKLRFCPAGEDHGVVFVRTDLPGSPEVAALISQVVKRPRRTVLRAGEATVETVEHCLSALCALGIDNVRVEVDAAELPAGDGSAQIFVDAILKAGIVAGAKARRVLTLNEPVTIRHDDSTVIAAVPNPKPGLEILYELDYSAHAAIGRQIGSFHLGVGDYQKEIACCRTFVLESEVAALQAMGVGKHLTSKDILVFGPQGPLAPNTVRFADESVRHKMLDLIGDLYLLGAPLQARIIAVKSGHALNHALARELANKLRQQEQQAQMLGRGVMDIRRIAKVLPHRYPMLLVDRVIELDGDRRALGVKNVTVNEPFFQGHFPTVPIMPGVLIVEAMAQLSGMLVSQTVSTEGQIAMLLSLDRVKLRRPVVPGDQLILEAESVRVRSSVAHMRCRAYVGEELAAEAEIKFILVDKDQV